ncbi:MAG: response regulator [Gammaproteobacteria bacterium]
MKHTTSEHLLVVDDDPQLRELLARYLGEQGFQVSAVADARGMDDLLKHEQPDLIILDLMLPGEDGLSIARRLRAKNAVPIIMLSARGEEVDRIVGLEVGADDYLPKPFNPRELLARIRAVLRRPNMKETASVNSRSQFGPFELDLERHALTRAGAELNLTAGEFALLQVLTEHPNQVLSRDRLIDLLKGYDRSPFDRSIDIRVTRLRRKIEDDPGKPQYLRTVWGEGYMFTPEG